MCLPVRCQLQKEQFLRTHQLYGAASEVLLCQTKDTRCQSWLCNIMPCSQIPCSSDAVKLTLCPEGMDSHSIRLFLLHHLLMVYLQLQHAETMSMKPVSWLTEHSVEYIHFRDNLLMCSFQLTFLTHYHGTPPPYSSVMSAQSESSTYGPLWEAAHTV